MISNASALALVFACIVVASCGSDSSSTGTPSPSPSSSSSSSSNGPSESSYVDACGARAARCGDAGAMRPDDCTGEYQCYTQAFVESVATEVLDCLSSRACDEPPVNACLRPIADRAGDKAFQQKCDERVGECGLDDDYCQEESALFKPEVRAAFETCFQKECAAILTCLDAALPACHF